MRDEWRKEEKGVCSHSVVVAPSAFRRRGWHGGDCKDTRGRLRGTGGGKAGNGQEVPTPKGKAQASQKSESLSKKKKRQRARGRMTESHRERMQRGASIRSQKKSPREGGAKHREHTTEERGKPRVGLCGDHLSHQQTIERGQRRYTCPIGNVGQSSKGLSIVNSGERKAPPSGAKCGWRLFSRAVATPKRKFKLVRNGNLSGSQEECGAAGTGNSAYAP